MAEFFDRAYRDFIDKGYPPHSAAAMASHAVAESQGDSRAVHDEGTGIGIYGWRDPKPGLGRKTDLKTWADLNKRDPYSVQTQLDFADYEMTKGKEAPIGELLKNASSYKEAQGLMMKYLRPRNPNVTPDRWNPGADAAGATPMPVAPPMGASRAISGVGPGGQGVVAETPPSGPVDITGGLLGSGNDPTAALARMMAVDEARKDEARQAAASAAAIKGGMGMMQGAAPPAQQPMRFAPMSPAQAYRPQQMAPFPQLSGGAPGGGQQMDPQQMAMLQQMMQQRLGRRMT